MEMMIAMNKMSKALESILLTLISKSNFPPIDQEQQVMVHNLMKMSQE